MIKLTCKCGCIFETDYAHVMAAKWQERHDACLTGNMVEFTMPVKDPCMAQGCQKTASNEHPHLPYCSEHLVGQVVLDRQ